MARRLHHSVYASRTALVGEEGDWEGWAIGEWARRTRGSGRARGRTGRKSVRESVGEKVGERVGDHKGLGVRKGGQGERDGEGRRKGREGRKKGMPQGRMTSRREQEQEVVHSARAGEGEEVGVGACEGE